MIMPDIAPEIGPTAPGRFREIAGRVAGFLQVRQLELGARILAGGAAAEPLRQILQQGQEPPPIDLSSLFNNPDAMAAALTGGAILVVGGRIAFDGIRAFLHRPTTLTPIDPKKYSQYNVPAKPSAEYKDEAARIVGQAGKHISDNQVSPTHKRS